MKLIHERPEDEAIDNALLQVVFDRQCKVSLMVPTIAELLYAARALWVASDMEWRELTPQQQAMYRQEAEGLVKYPQPLVVPLKRSLAQPDGDSRDLNFDGQEQN